jgi:O-methyltransferase involved in polyketide biosynthesis
MTDSEGAAPPTPVGVDVDKASAARMYDWFLGGSHNYAVDREFGKRMLAAFPLARPIARSNRAWMNRVVRAAIDAGIRQFLDLGSGVPTVGNVHEVVLDALPDGERATVVYVDYEEVAAAHARITLEQQDVTDWASFVQCDLRDPAGVLDNPDAKRLLDPDQPTCLLLVAALHFLGPDDAPGALVDQYRNRLMPGSWLAISHATIDDAPTENTGEARKAADSYKTTNNPLWLRTRDEVEEFFGGWPLVEPGLVHLTDWRADNPQWMSAEDDEVRPYLWGGVAQKPR